MAHILAVDDEPVLHDLISAELRLEGHDVETVLDPFAFEEVLITHSQIDVLITGTNTKSTSGFELVTLPRRRRIACPLIFTSASDELSRVVAESLGHRAVIKKPFTADQLHSAVHIALVSRKGKRQNAA